MAGNGIRERARGKGGARGKGADLAPAGDAARPGFEIGRQAASQPTRGPPGKPPKWPETAVYTRRRREWACCGGSLRVPPDPVFDDLRARVNVGSESRPVPAQPWTVIEVLRAHPGRRLPRGYLLSMLPGSPSDRALDVYVTRARRALTGTPLSILTVRGHGFALVRSETQ